MTVAALGVTAFALARSASAQYFTNFDNLVGSAALSDQDGWVTNDEYTGATYNPTPSNPNNLRQIGQSEDVTVLDGFSSPAVPPATSSTDQLAILGGVVNQTGGAVPGRQTVYVYHATNLPTSSNLFFSTDYVVTPTGTTVRTNHDSFGFAFLTAGGVSLFSVDFVPTPTTSMNFNTKDNVSYTVNGTQSAGVASFSLNSRYHLTVSVNVVAGVGGTFSALLTPENMTGGDNGVTVTLATNVAFTGTIANIGAAWTLFSNTNAASNGSNSADYPVANDPTSNTNTTAYTNGGNNSMYFDNFSISVPEPSTYVALGLGAAVLGLALRRRRVV